MLSMAITVLGAIALKMALDYNRTTTSLTNNDITLHRNY